MEKKPVSKSVTSEYTRIAFYYYKSGMTQNEIAKKMGISRQKVNRVLGECLQLGIVQINISGCDDTYICMESQLEDLYGLRHVRICQDPEQSGQDDVYTALSEAASSLIASTVSDNDIIGFGHGKTMAALAKQIVPMHKENLKAISLVGANHGPEYQTGSGDIIFNCAVKMGATPILLHAPILVDKSELRDSLVEETYFKETYQTIKACTIAVFGIGDATGFSHSKYENSKNPSAVGEICTHFYDEDGKEVYPDISQHTIAISKSDLKEIPLRIGVAGGGYKLSAVKGAIRGGYINTLITDFSIAEKLLQKNI